MTEKLLNRVMPQELDLAPQQQAYRLAGFALITIHMFLNLIFIGISTANGLPKMALINTVGTIVGIFNIFLYLSRSETNRNIGGSLVIWNGCFYVISTTYILGGNRNITVLFPFMILVVHSFFNKKTKYLTINSLVILVTYILYCFIKFYMYPEQLDNASYLCVANDMFAIGGTIGFLYFKDTVEKYANKYKDKQIKALAKEVNADFLTGLSNRRYAREYVLAKTDRKNDYVVICDIDHFKHVNDTYGHSCGDYVIKEIADILKKSFRTSDLVCRWGGEEFLIYINKASNEVVKERLEKLRDIIENYKFEYDEHVFNITMSFGYCRVDDTIEIENNLKSADEALYYSKNHGRNMVVDSRDISNQSIEDN